MPKDCPKCRLVNPAEAQRCDCGWDFVTRSQERSYIEHKRHPAAAAAGIGVGVICGLMLLRLMFKFVAAGSS